MGPGHSLVSALSLSFLTKLRRHHFLTFHTLSSPVHTCFSPTTPLKLTEHRVAEASCRQYLLLKLTDQAQPQHPCRGFHTAGASSGASPLTPREAPVSLHLDRPPTLSASDGGRGLQNLPPLLVPHSLTEQHAFASKEALFLRPHIHGYPPTQGPDLQDLAKATQKLQDGLHGSGPSSIPLCSLLPQVFSSWSEGR